MHRSTTLYWDVSLGKEGLQTNKLWNVLPSTTQSLWMLAMTFDFCPFTLSIRLQLSFVVTMPTTGHKKNVLFVNTFSELNESSPFPSENISDFQISVKKSLFLLNLANKINRVYLIEPGHYSERLIKQPKQPFPIDTKTKQTKNTGPQNRQYCFTFPF